MNKHKVKHHRNSDTKSDRQQRTTSEPPSWNDESNKSNRTGKGPYSVTITLTSDSSEVSNCVTSGKQGLLPLHKGTGNYETPTGRNVLGETNRDCCGYQSITRGTNGFSLKRFLPREVTGESTNAYLLTRSSSRAIESGNTLGFNALGLRSQCNQISCHRHSNEATPRASIFTHTGEKIKIHTGAKDNPNTGDKDNPIVNYTSDTSDMSGHIVGMENPAFSDDKADIGTSGNYRTVIDGNEAPHYMVGADELNAYSGKTDDEDAAHISGTLDSSKTTGQDKSVPTAQVAPRVQAEQVPDTSGNSETAKDVQVTDLDSVAIAINGGTEKKNEDVAVNMQLERVKRSVKKTNSLQGIFNKVRTPSQKELDPSDEDTKWLEWIEVKFQDIAGDDGEISRDEFKVALGVKKSFFAERFFELFDQDASGTIELSELMDGLRMLTKGTPAQKLQFLFDVYDVDGSGTIERDELKEVLKACMEESSLSLTEDNIADLTDVLFEAADADESGSVTFDELRAELEKHPGVIENLTISAAQWLKGPAKSKSTFKIPRHCTKKYLLNNLRKVIYFFVYWIVNIVLFAYAAAWQYRDSNNWIKIARGCGLCLNFNCMWVVVLMLRKCLTFVRMTKLCHILPLDQSIMFHKMTGLAIAGFSLVHSVAHVGNAATVSNTSALEMWEVLFTTKAEVGFVAGSAFITGWILDVILIIMVIFSMPFVRRTGYFQVFYWTHMLYVPFWILVILHGPHFWKWFVAPGAMFILEKKFRSKLIKLARYGETYVEEVNLLPSGVTHLIITRPINFKYKPGDYVFLQIPVIAAHEWHPFTISSAPEMDGHIWLHVRSAGHWTNKLYKYFDELEVKEPIKARAERKISQFSGFERAFSRKDTSTKNRRVLSKKKSASTKSANRRQTNKIVKVKCFIDGPYGTGTREVFNAEHAVLIGSGIGVTPMASILQSVWYRFNESRQVCPSCAHTWYREEEISHLNLNKVDFIWINRDQKAFEWFLTILNQLEVEQSAHHGALEKCIQMHLYMTAAQKKTDMKGIGLQIALELMYEKSNVDLITGLKTKTEPGRPDFDQVFKAIKAENQGKVKVFFCGAPQLGRTVKEAAQRYGFAFCKENF